LMTGCSILSDSIHKLIQVRWEYFVIISTVFGVGVICSPFPVTILNHSPRLMFSVPSNKDVRKNGQTSSFRIFVFWLRDTLRMLSQLVPKGRKMTCRPLSKFFERYFCAETAVPSKGGA
jgi:hypothetical protein